MFKSLPKDFTLQRGTFYNCLRMKDDPLVRHFIRFDKESLHKAKIEYNRTKKALGIK